MNLQNLIDAARVWGLADPLDGIVVPSPMSKEQTRAAIMMRCGLLEPIYHEPEVFASMLSTWFVSHAWTMEHLNAIIAAQYSPIENTDRYSEHTQENDGTETVRRDVEKKETETVNREDGGQDQKITDKDNTYNSSVNVSGDETETRTDTISAENSSSYQPDSQHTTDGENSRTETHSGTDGENTEEVTKYGKTGRETRAGSGTETGSDTRTNSGKTSYIEHTHGNIGVTSNQDMINQELDLLERFSVYSWIAEQIEKEFFIQVY